MNDRIKRVAEMEKIPENKAKDYIEKMDKILDKRDDKVLNPDLDVLNNIYKLWYSAAGIDKISKERTQYILFGEMLWEYCLIR